MRRMAVWLAALGVFLLDRLAKGLAVGGLAVGSTVPVLPGVLEWRLTHNAGVALGLLSGNTVAVLVLPIALVLLGWAIFRRFRTTPFTRFAMALAAGGFAGNLLDRILQGYVVDMIYFPWMPWYICNPADIAICLGVALLAVSLIWRPQDWMRKSEAKTRETDRTDRAD